MTRRSPAAGCWAALLSGVTSALYAPTAGTVNPWQMELAKPLKEAGVKRLNLSLDTLDDEKYAYITRIGSLADFQAGLNAVRRSHTGRDMNQIGG